jgi:hypothetical protein
VSIKLALILSEVALYELKVFENRALRKTAGSTSEEVAGSYRKLHTDELQGLYSSPLLL